MNKIRVLNSAQAILKRPLMYTMTGSIPEVLTALSVWDTAIRSRDYFAVTSCGIFLNWLFSEYDVSNEKNCWAQIQEALLEKYESDEEAIKALAELAMTHAVTPEDT